MGGRKQPRRIAGSPTLSPRWVIPTVVVLFVMLTGGLAASLVAGRDDGNGRAADPRAVAGAKPSYHQPKLSLPPPPGHAHPNKSALGRGGEETEPPRAALADVGARGQDAPPPARALGGRLTPPHRRES